MKFFDKFFRSSEKRQIALIKKQPFLIANIENPSIDMMISAVEANYKSIGVIDNPSSFLIEFAIRQNVRALKYLPPQSQDTNYYAVMENPRAICYIKHPSKHVAKLACTKMGNLIQYIDASIIDEDLEVTAVLSSPESISKIKNPSISAMTTAVSMDYTVLSMIDKPPVGVVIAALKLYQSSERTIKSFNLLNCQLSEDEWWLVAREFPKYYHLMKLNEDQINYCKICS